MPNAKSCEDTNNSINLLWRLLTDFNYLAMFLFTPFFVFLNFSGLTGEKLQLHLSKYGKYVFPHLLALVFIWCFEQIWSEFICTCFVFAFHKYSGRWVYWYSVSMLAGGFQQIFQNMCRTRILTLIIHTGLIITLMVRQSYVTDSCI